MKRPATAQEWIHWLELGGGARPVRRIAILLGLLLLSLRVLYTLSHGPAYETTLLQADVGRQLALGQGFTTLVNYPQTAALMRQRHGVRLDLAGTYPELHQAPLYSMVIAAGLRLMPAGWRSRLFAAPAALADGYNGDYYLLGLNLGLLWLAAWMTYRLGRRLFDERVGWVALLAFMLSAGVWEQLVLVDGLPLLMVLVLVAFTLLTGLEERAAAGPAKRGGGWRLAALGAVCGLLFLAEYSAGLLGPVAAAFALARLFGRQRRLWLVAVG